MKYNDLKYKNFILSGKKYNYEKNNWLLIIGCLLIYYYRF